MKILPDQMDHIYRKRKRTVLTAKQHKILSKFFQECTFPDSEQRKILGRSLNMTPRTVQIWFQNQRQKVRNQNEDQRSMMGSGDGTTEDSHDDITKQKFQGKSLNMLANAACIEYYRKFGESGHKDTENEY